MDSSEWSLCPDCAADADPFTAVKDGPDSVNCSELDPRNPSGLLFEATAAISTIGSARCVSELEAEMLTLSRTSMAIIFGLDLLSDNYCSRQLSLSYLRGEAFLVQPLCSNCFFKKAVTGRKRREKGRWVGYCVCGISHAISDTAKRRDARRSNVG